MANGNKKVPEFPLVPSADSGYLYIVKNNIDYHTFVGQANGVATLDADAKVPVAQVPNFPASKITTGTLSPLRMGTGVPSASNYLRGDGVWTTISIPALSWGAITGTLSSQTDLWAALNGKANVSHTHDASAITSGRFVAARLGVGTADSSTFLRGDGFWAPTSSGAATWGQISGTISNQSDLWSQLQSKAPASHSHAASHIVSGTMDPARLGTGTPTAAKYLRGDGVWVAISADTNWGGIGGTLSSQTDLQAALNAKQANLGFTPVRQGGLGNTIYLGWNGGRVEVQVDATNFGGLALVSDLTWNSIQNKPATFPPSSHTHFISQISGLQAALDAKANVANPSFTGNMTLSGTGTATNWVATSDATMKDNIEPIQARDRLANLLQFVRFMWLHDGKYDVGLIAQQVREVAPEYVYEYKTRLGETKLSIDKASLALECVIGLANRVDALEGN